jgi:predicted secreted protein
MVKWLVVIFILGLSGLTLASEHQIIDTLGVSGKGQFVAIEEYGYKSHGHTYYVKIKVMNVWKKEYVGSPVEVELPAHRPSSLNKARSEARAKAQDQLSRFGISG